MNFNQLKYIIAVNRHRNFARAADECGTAQSNLSKEIQRLEKEFKVMIFDRSRHPVVPTLKGIDLIRQAKIILLEYDRFHEIASQRKNSPEGNFRLGILPGLAPYLLPLFTQTLTEKYPLLKLQVFEMNQKEMADYFETDHLDGAITISPFFKEGYYEETLFEEKFVLYVSPGHPLSALPGVKWSDIPLNELILQEDIKTYLLHRDPKQNKPLAIIKNTGALTLQNGSLETIRKMIDRNGGLTLLPELACLYMGERRLKMVRQIKSPALSRTISLITPRGFQNNRIIKVIKKEIIAHLPVEMADITN